jgi:hypothetical protein
MTLEWVRRAVLVLGLLPALACAAYKGVLLSTNAQPGWKDARWLGGYLTNAALVVGCAEMLALSVVTGQASAAVTLRSALELLLVLNLIPLGLLIANLWPTLVRTFTRTQLACTGMVTLGAGTLIPLGLLLVGDNSLLMLGAVGLILLGNLVIRFVLIKIPQAFSCP